MLSSGVSAHLAASNKISEVKKNGDKVSSQCYYRVRREIMNFPTLSSFPEKWITPATEYVGLFTVKAAA